MGTQISIKLSNKMIKAAKAFAKDKGYDNLQDFIRETMRERLFGKEDLSGLSTYLASEKSLARSWLSKEEDKAWEFLQKEI